MELYVRSQDKMKLTRVIDIGIFEEQEGYTIYYDDSIDNMLGTYATKERALEVLDEIQKILQPTIFIKDGECDFVYKDDRIYRMNVEGMKNSEIQELSTYVYEMPEE